MWVYLNVNLKRKKWIFFKEKNEDIDKTVQSKQRLGFVKLLATLALHLQIIVCLFYSKKQMKLAIDLDSLIV